MEKFVATIIDPIGLHARPASKIVSVAAKFKSDIKIVANGNTANAKSIMNIMALAVKQGQEIEVLAEGEDSSEALQTIKDTMVENNLI